MANKDHTIKEALKRELEVYGVPNDRQYDTEDMLYYQQKFLLRYLDTSTQLDREEAVNQMIIVSSWFVGLVNRFHLDLEEGLAKRYAYKCPFCLEMPCDCRDQNHKAMKTGRPTARRPKTLAEFQKMISKIYVDDNLAELNSRMIQEQDNLHFHFRLYRRELGQVHFRNLSIQCLDYFVLMLRIFNAFERDFAIEFFRILENGCWVCKQTPCVCFFSK